MLKRKHNIRIKNKHQQLRFSQTDTKSSKSNNQLKTMEQKLQTLREKLNQKKKQHQKSTNKLSQQSHINKLAQNFLSCRSQSNIPLSFDKRKITEQEYAFDELMIKLKMEKFKSELIDEGITTIEQLFCLDEEEIDFLSGIPIGYRIKLKKLIKYNQEEKKQEKKKQKKQENQGKELHQEEIQKIIERRKEQLKFEPLTYYHKYQQNNIDQKQVLNQEQQQIMTKITNFFDWSQKQIKSNKNIDQKQHKNYCWGCLKNIQQPISLKFCSEICKFDYESKMEIDHIMLQTNQLAQKQFICRNKQENDQIGNQKDFQYILDLNIQ